MSRFHRSPSEARKAAMSTTIPDADALCCSIVYVGDSIRELTMTLAWLAHLHFSGDPNEENELLALSESERIQKDMDA